MLLPRARTQDVTVEDLTDELLIYDAAQAQGHCLNEVSSMVWRACDGKTSVAEVASQLQKAGLVAADEAENYVYAALVDLERNHLLAEPLPLAAEGMTRAEFLKRVATVVGIAALITTINLARPSAAEAY